MRCPNPACVLYRNVIFTILKLFCYHKNVRWFQIHLDRWVFMTVKCRPIKSKLPHHSVSKLRLSLLLRWLDIARCCNGWNLNTSSLCCAWWDRTWFFLWVKAKLAIFPNIVVHKSIVRIDWTNTSHITDLHVAKTLLWNYFGKNPLLYKMISQIIVALYVSGFQSILIFTSLRSVPICSHQYWIKRSQFEKRQKLAEIPEICCWLIFL